MTQALRLIGYSNHTGNKRFGPKAQLARWGLGEDDFPEEWAEMESNHQPAPYKSATLTIELPAQLTLW